MARSSKRAKPTRDGILASAERLFGDRGYGDPPLRDVIAAAGCSTTAFYSRFGGKDAVLDALVEDLLGELQEAAITVVTSARTVDEGYAAGIEALVRVLAGRKGLVRVTLTEGMAVEPVRKRVTLAWAALAGLLQRGLRDGHDTRAWALVGALSFAVLRWSVLDQLDDDGLVAALNDVATLLRPESTQA